MYEFPGALPPAPVAARARVGARSAAAAAPAQLLLLLRGSERSG